MTDQAVQLKIEIENTNPVIWRRVEVSTKTNLRALHEVIQAVMPWENYHLYQFQIGDRIYGEPSPDDTTWGPKTYQAKTQRLESLIAKGVTTFLYTYDFGDNWQHRVTFETVSDALPDQDLPRFLGGERRAPPEDVGGPFAFEEFLEAMSKRSHPQRKDLTRWYGGPFKATEIDAEEIHRHMDQIAARRKIALEAFQRSQRKD